MRNVMIILFVLTCFTQAAAQKKPALVSYANPDVVSTPTGYSHVASVDLGNAKMVIISGQVPLDNKGGLVGGNNFSLQAEKVFENLKAILSSLGGAMSDVVKTGIYITDGANVASFREVRNKYVNLKSPPASTLVVVKGLFRPDILIEVEATAIIPK